MVGKPEMGETFNQEEDLSKDYDRYSMLKPLSDFNVSYQKSPLKND